MMIQRLGVQESLVVTGPCVITVCDTSQKGAKIGITGDKDSALVLRFGQLNEAQITSVAAMMADGTAEQVRDRVASVHKAMA